jgi:hypothetical protein
LKGRALLRHPYFWHFVGGLCFRDGDLALVVWDFRRGI